MVGAPSAPGSDGLRKALRSSPRVPALHRRVHLLVFQRADGESALAVVTAHAVEEQRHVATPQFGLDVAGPFADGAGQQAHDRHVRGFDVGTQVPVGSGSLDQFRDGRIQPQPCALDAVAAVGRSEEHTSELQSRQYLVCRLLLEKKKKNIHSYLAVKKKKIRSIKLLV